MNLLARLFMLLLATMLLVFALAFISVVLLLSTLRWMLTGQKPSFVMYVQAYRRWKNMAAGGGQPFPRRVWPTHPLRSGAPGQGGARSGYQGRVSPLTVGDKCEGESACAKTGDRPAAHIADGVSQHRRGWCTTFAMWLKAMD